jgi:hypothetical protein
LTDPDEYIDLIDGKSRRFEHFICLAKEDALITEEADHYRFEEKLRADYDLDVIRLENPIAMYNNEVAPIRRVRETLIEALEAFDDIDRRLLANWRFDDELNAWAAERSYYSDPRFDDINASASCWSTGCSPARLRSKAMASICSSRTIRCWASA